MRYSQLLTRTSKKAPADELTTNAKLLVRAGFVNKLMAGAYSYLPLGLRVLRKIEAIVREEIDGIGGQEILMPGLHPAENWRQTGGWDSIDILFKIKSRTGKDYALGQSHEEVVTPLVKDYVQSYKDLPVFVYQIQNKYRDELRAKSGILRGREFGMKDMYSFHTDQADFDRFYAKAKEAYLRVYSRCGLTAKVTEASGGCFSKKISYEFMILTDAGEDDVLFCPKCDYCINVEIAKTKKGDPCPHCGAKMDLARATEAGNVFDLGQKYTHDFEFYVLGPDGEKIYPIMGCYGIGTTRLMGTVVEKWADEKGLVWPEAIAPFAVHLLALGEEKETIAWADKVYEKLTAKGIEVLYDDRHELSAGEKFADADLIGIPYRAVISGRGTKEKKIGWKKRTAEKEEQVDLGKILALF